VETDAYIAVGSNCGDRELNLLRSVAEVGKLPASRVTGLSSFYQTSPVGNKNQENFFNAVIRLSTELAPRPLLNHLLRIETEIFRRTRTVHQGPRSMDLDLLLYGAEIVTETDLIVPHPHMTKRRFVLQPLCEIAPQLIHPMSGRTINELLCSLKSDETVIKI
jgi:2-amino-4-hydroxy-6-hydroxymethyldihydropteridine diphosphokinase